MDYVSVIQSQKADLLEANLQIAQLTTENERLTRVVEQATKEMIVQDDHIFVSNSEGWLEELDHKDVRPDLYAQLKGDDRG
jgi:hypothetical protein